MRNILPFILFCSFYLPQADICAQSDYPALMKGGEKDYYDKNYQSSADQYIAAEKKAIKDFGDNSPERMSATMSLVYVYQALNDLARVEATLSNVVRLSNNLNSKVANVIDLVERTGDYLRTAQSFDNAAKFYQVAIKMHQKANTASGMNYYWDVKYTMDHLYNNNKRDSTHYFFLEMISALPNTDNLFASTLKDWTNFSISSKTMIFADRIEKNCEEYLRAKEGKNEKDNWYAETWITMGKLFKTKGQIERALNCFTEARKTIAPIVDRSQNQNLYCLGYIIETYNEAKTYNAQSAALLAEFERANEKIATDNPADYIDHLGTIFIYHYQRSDFNNAELTLEKSMPVTEKIKGRQSDDYRVQLVAYRSLIERTGHKEKLKGLPELSSSDGNAMVKALDLENGSKDVDDLGRFVSEGNYLKAIEIFEKRGDMMMNYYRSQNNHEPLVQTLQVLAVCYKETGNLARSGEMLMTGEKIALEYLPPTNFTVPLAIMQVGAFYASTGSLREAESRYYTSMKILDDHREKTDKKENDATYYKVLSNLASLYTQMKSFEEAEDLTLKVLNYYRSVYPDNSPEIVAARIDLGNLYTAMELNADAEHIYLECEPFMKKTYGENNINYINFISGLASVYQQRGKYERAEPLYLKCREFFLKTLGNKSERFIAISTDLAMMYYHTGRLDKAKENFKSINDLMLYQADNFFPSLSEKERTLFYSSTYRRFNIYNSFAINYVPKRPEEANEMYDLQLLSKGMLFKAFNKMRESIQHSKNDSLKILYQRWISAKNNLSRIYQMSDREKASSGIDEKKVEAFANSLEKKLSQQSELFSSMIVKRPNWKSIQQKLKPGEAAVEIVRLWNSVPAYKFDYIGKGTYFDTLGRDGYARIIQLASDRCPGWKAGMEEYDIITKLDGFSTKDKTEAELLEMMRKPSVKFSMKRRADKKDYEVTVTSDSVFVRYFERTTIYAALILRPENASNAELVLLPNGDQLESRYINYYNNVIRTKSDDRYSYQYFWKPIQEKLGDSKKIFFSPDGVYNSININTLKNPESGKYLIDEIEVVQVSNTADVLLPPSGTSDMKAVLIGFPDYYKKTVKTPAGNLKDSSYSILAADTSQRFIEGSTITDLPGTMGEVNTIAGIMQSMKMNVNKYLAADASEENLKKIHSPKVLHIATHGFFLKEIGATTTADGRSLTGVLDKKMIENPLLRTGLLLAGSGKTISGERDANTDDGILTAYEAMNLDLEDTDLVVMSACETGLGQLRSGEGVYGLQRAFRAAGANSVLMSMWKVDDQATQQLMSEFYSQWLKAGEKQNSFRDAQLKLREKFPHPYYWGAFVLVGQ